MIEAILIVILWSFAGWLLGCGIASIWNSRRPGFCSWFLQSGRTDGWWHQKPPEPPSQVWP
jgi:hypothetical protein